jgi:transposase
LLEDALIKVSSVASKMDTLSVRDTLEALIGGERDPRRLAQLARGRLKSKHGALVEALSGQFDEHHAEFVRMLLDQIDGLSVQIEQLITRAEQLLQSIPAAQAADQQAGGGAHPPGAGGQPQPSTPPGDTVARRAHTGLTASERLDEISGIGPLAAQVIIAEIGLEMSRFPTPGHLVSWVMPCSYTAGHDRYTASAAGPDPDPGP